VKAYQQILKSSSNDINSIFEVVYKYHIKPFKDFKMLSGFKSFQPIRKGIKLALSNNQPVYSKF
jgi:succinylglutamate desuccinylase